MYTIPMLRVLLMNAKERVDKKSIQYLIDGHPDTVCDAIWAEMTAKKESDREHS